jgi:radical SAM superfamily enzyme YgiQ (UPF0313 family)
MKIAFIRGPVVARENAINNEATPSIGMAYLTAYSKRAGHEVHFIDAVAEGLNRVWTPDEFPGFACQGLTFAETIDRIPADVDVLAFSIMFSGEWPVHRNLIRKARERFPDVLIVAGGEHITALTEYSLRDCHAIDLCVRGEGEYTMAKVLDRHGAKAGFADLPGVCYLNDKSRFAEVSSGARIRDIDSLPWPHWPEGYLEKFWHAGKSFGVQSERDMPIMASRGCPYQCTFCSNPQMWTTRYILRDIDDLVAEIRTYVEKYRITALQFYDLTAITKKSWTVDFCRRLKAEGIRLAWSLPSGTRSEALDSETLALMKDVGCNYLVYAPESGSEKTLERIKKRIKLPDLTQSIMTARKLGITVRANLIIGFPGETRRDIFKSILYGLKLSVLGVDEVPINLYSCYPGSELFRDLVSAGRIQLSDDYFLSLASINSDFAAMRPMTMNEHIGPWELAMYRLLAMLANYSLGYLIYFPRIFRTLRNVFGGSSHAATVFEHRLKDARKRRATSAA